MTVSVRVYHNVATDHVGRPLGMLDGYSADHPVTLVFRTEESDAKSDLYVCEEMWRLLNVGDDPEFGTPDPRAVEYRERRNRSLSIGDVVSVDDRFYKVASIGFEPIARPRVAEATMHGTTPLA